MPGVPKCGKVILANTVDIALAFMHSVSQNFDCFNQDHYSLVPYNSLEVLDSFLKFYFAPWDNPFALWGNQQLTIEKWRSKQQENIQKALKNPGFGINRARIDRNAIESLSTNMCLDFFPNVEKQATIVVCGTHLRNFPSYYRSFTVPFADDQGYPFDNWQVSYLTTNEPLCVIHQSTDKQWCFVVTGSYCFGWVRQKDMAVTDLEFVEAWRTGQYVTPLSENLLIEIKGFSPSSRARIGQLIPLSKNPSIEQIKIYHLDSSD